jgi:predicted ATPase
MPRHGGPARGLADGRPVRRFRRDPAAPIDTSRWPGTVPAVAQVLRDGLDVAAGLTVLVGENGSGKSTVIEMLAEAYGLNPQGGSVLARYRTRDSEPGIGSHLVVERGPDRPRWSYFLRADTMHGLYTYLEDNPGKAPERFHELSHGEGFLAPLPHRPGCLLPLSAQRLSHAAGRRRRTVAA